MPQRSTQAVAAMSNIESGKSSHPLLDEMKRNSAASVNLMTFICFFLIIKFFNFIHLFFIHHLFFLFLFLCDLLFSCFDFVFI